MPQRLSARSTKRKLKALMSEARLLRDAREIFDSALRDCSVERVYERKLHFVQLGEKSLLNIAGETLDLTGVRHLRIVSAGKAASAMVMGFLSRVPVDPFCEIKGVLISRDRPEGLPEKHQEFFAGGHPLPNKASFAGALAALSIVHEAATLKDSLCLYFISGGASAMMELPSLRISLSKIPRSSTNCSSTAARPSPRSIASESTSPQ